MEKYYFKNFDSWNSKKKDLEKRILPEDFFFLEGEVWWASLGINIGAEIDGKNDLFERPVLVYKKITEELLIALPITSKPRKYKCDYSTSYNHSRRTILLSQTRTISSKRLLRLIHRLNNKEFEIIKKNTLNLSLTTKAIPSD